MSNVFELPRAWLVTLLSEWLDMPSIGMLDTATSSTKYRLLFLSMLQSMRSTSIDVFSTKTGRAFLGWKVAEWTGWWWRWLSIRQIHVESIILSGNDVTSNSVIPSMRVVVAEEFNHRDLKYLVRNCPALRSVTIQLVDPHHATSRGLELLVDLHPTLEEFYFRGYRLNVSQEIVESSEILISILSRCTCLRKISLTEDALRLVNIEEFVPYCHLIVELELFDDERTLDIGQLIANLLTHCSNLRTLQYNCCSNDQQDLLNIAEIPRCPLLEDLYLAVLPSATEHMQTAVANLFTLLGRNCKHLHSLSLCGGELYASALRSIARIETLKSLHLDSCDVLADVAVLATMKLERLVIDTSWLEDSDTDTEVAALLSALIGSNISQTLETFEFSTGAIDDIHVAASLASCRKLKRLSANISGVFGTNGLGGLQAMAMGCPLLSDISLALTVSGIHYIGKHEVGFANVKKCHVFRRGEEFPSIKELQTLYPAITWA